MYIIVAEIEIVKINSTLVLNGMNASSGDDLKGFRCCLLRCLVVSKSQLRECGDLWSQRIQKTVGLPLSAPLSTYTDTSLQIQNSSVSLILQISFMLQLTWLRGILRILRATVRTLNVFSTYSCNTNKDVYYCKSVSGCVSFFFFYLFWISIIEI